MEKKEICTEKIIESIKVPEGTMIVGQNKYFDMEDMKTKTNNNVVVVGGSGAGKTTGIVEPNILQAIGSYVISDPKGNLYGRYKEYLKLKGYDVKKIDFKNPRESIKYNMFQQAFDRNDMTKSEANITKLTHMIVKTCMEGTHGTDIFWEKAAELLLKSIISYLIMVAPSQYQNFQNVQRLINALEISENDPECKSELDYLFEEFEEKNPGSFVIRNYKSFRAAAGRTLKSIQIESQSLINSYCNDEIDSIMYGDELFIPDIGRKKTALFICVSDTDRTYDGLVNIIFSQIMNGLVEYADSRGDSRLPIPVRFIMDDFATNVCIDDFPRMISSIRSRGISATILIQAESQLKHYYGGEGQTILGNCDTYVYLGGNDVETAHNVAIRANKTLYSILQMPVGYGWLFRRGEKPAYIKAFNVFEYREKLFKDFEYVK